MRSNPIVRRGPFCNPIRGPVPAPFDILGRFGHLLDPLGSHNAEPNKVAGHTLCGLGLAADYLTRRIRTRFKIGGMQALAQLILTGKVIQNLTFEIADGSI